MRTSAESMRPVGWVERSAAHRRGALAAGVRDGLRYVPPILLVALISCAHKVPPKPHSETVDAAAKRVLHAKAYLFCHQNKLPIYPWDQGWCDIAKRATTCPELVAMCARKVPCDHGLFSSSKAKANACVADEKKKPKTNVGAGNSAGTPWYERIKLPGLQYLAWIALGLVLALVAFFVVRAILNRQPQVALDAPVPGAAPAVVAVIEDRGLGEVARLLRRARELAESDVGLALAHLYAAALKHLEEAGLIRWDRTTTNREYVRTIRGKTPIDRPVAELVREVERTKFGHLAPARQTFETLYSRLAPALARGAVLVLLLLATFTSGCGSCEGNPGLDGHAAFTDVLRSQGLEVGSFEMPIDKLSGRDVPVIVDSGDFDFDATVLSALERAMLSGARILVLLAKGVDLPTWPRLKVIDTAAGPLAVDDALAQAGHLPAKAAAYLPDKLALASPKTERDSPEVLVERDGKPFAERWRSQDGEIVFVADRRLIQNASLAVPGNARLAVALAEEIAGPKKAIQFAELGPIFPASSPVDSLERAGLWALVLQALLVLALLVVARGRAFGALRDHESTTRRAFAEHVSALGVQLARRRGSRLAASLYASYALDRLRHRASREAGRDLDALAKDLAPRLGEDEGDVRRLLNDAEGMRMEPNGISVPERDLVLVRRLGQVLWRLQGERGAGHG